MTTKKTRATINLPTKAHTKLSRLTILMRSKGYPCYKQEIVAHMTDYFSSRPLLLQNILSSKSSK